MSFPSAAFHGSHTHKLANWRIIKRPAGESLHLGVSFTIRNDMQAMEWHTGQEPHKRSVLLLKRKCAKCSVGNNKLAQFRALELIMVGDYTQTHRIMGTDSCCVPRSILPWRSRKESLNMRRMRLRQAFRMEMHRSYKFQLDFQSTTNQIQEWWRRTPPEASRELFNYLVHFSYCPPLEPFTLLLHSFPSTSVSFLPQLKY